MVVLFNLYIDKKVDHVRIIHEYCIRLLNSLFVHVQCVYMMI